MVKLKALVVCILIVATDVAAGILGLGADAAQNKAVKHLRLGILDCRYGLWMFRCREPRRKALKLALGAALLLSLAHVLTNLLGGCMRVCCRGEFRRAYSNRKLSLACLVSVWIILAVGLSMLVIGMSSNKNSRASYGFRPRSYGFRHHHLLSIGGVLCFVHGLFSVAFYVSSTAANDEDNKQEMSSSEDIHQ
ncbi:VASCULATURE COMPLEXITY AND CONNECTIVITY [Hibiscus trionum]|uniref:VASCULATURE COMPLEXITY AND CONNECTIVITY n=1 Tax=Hibiscus trionum TaxID=183268 RepID=A0A9W7LPW9_HIBTR|nr:VASCULATURE COMPLEXITY AND CONNECTIVITY [Hibiscus trionum]